METEVEEEEEEEEEEERQKKKVIVYYYKIEKYLTRMRVSHQAPGTARKCSKPCLICPRRNLKSSSSPY